MFINLARLNAEADVAFMAVVAAVIVVIAIFFGVVVVSRIFFLICSYLTCVTIDGNYPTIM